MNSVAEIRAFIDEFAKKLDPESRYVRELLHLIEGTGTAEEVEQRLSSAECRGARHARAAYAKMSLGEKLIANLITAETSPLRFEDAEIAVIERTVSALEKRPLEILVLPCSRGDEAYSVAHFLRGVDHRILAVDAQPALIDSARANDFSDWPSPLREEAPALRAKISFEVGDAFSPPDRRFDLIFCRNFLGHFIEPVALRCARGLRDKLAPGGVLFLDAFCLRKFAALRS
jgi:chemotaxis methyl-accepting protein methylase